MPGTSAGRLMEREGTATKNTDLLEHDAWDGYPRGPVIKAGAGRDAEWLRTPWVTPPTVIRLAHTEPPAVDESGVRPQKMMSNPYSGSSTSIGEFVERRFIPEHVAIKRPAGRSYFRTILN